MRLKMLHIIGQHNPSFLPLEHNCQVCEPWITACHFFCCNFFMFLRCSVRGNALGFIGVDSLLTRSCIVLFTLYRKRGPSTYDVCSRWVEGGTPKADETKGGCTTLYVTRGVQKSEHFANIICGWSEEEDATRVGGGGFVRICKITIFVPCFRDSYLII